VAIGALRVGTASLILFAAGWREVGALRALKWREWRWVLLAGAFLGVHFGTWIASLSFTSTAASVALVATNPMFAAMFGTLLGDRVSRREVAGMAVAAAGCAVLAGGDWRAGGNALVGDVLALVGAATAAAYFVVGRRLRESVPLLPYLGCVNAVAACGLLVASLAWGVRAADVPGHAVVACVGAAVVASFVGHSLLNAAVRVTPTHLVALAVLGEPIGSSLISWISCHEQPPVHAAIGGAIVIAGIAVGFAKKREAAARVAS
jgi:drug/metabolite transporter (DMT)-like permease